MNARKDPSKVHIHFRTRDSSLNFDIFQVMGRVLAPPVIDYKATGTSNVNEGQWRMNKVGSIWHILMIHQTKPTAGSDQARAADPHQVVRDRVVGEP